MNLNHKIAKQFLTVLAVGLVISACQKMERPGFGELVLDPPPPPYSTLKSFWGFENNVGDSGQFRALSVAKNITYVAGINGQAAQIGADGYLLMATIHDSLKIPGSFTLAFWMKGVGPVQGGAQGLFAISNTKEFWGNLELFLENHNNGAEAFLKVHMWNSAAPDGKGEAWIEPKIPNVLNKWTHIAVTYNETNSQVAIYADGVAVDVNGTDPGTSKVLGAGNYGPIKWKDAGGMVIGSFAFQTTPSQTNHGPETWAKSFNGPMDQVRFYITKALTPAEITDLFTTKK